MGHWLISSGVTHREAGAARTQSSTAAPIKSDATEAEEGRRKKVTSPPLALRARGMADVSLIQHNHGQMARASVPHGRQRRSYWEPLETLSGPIRKIGDKRWATSCKVAAQHYHFDIAAALLHGRGVAKILFYYIQGTTCIKGSQKGGDVPGAVGGIGKLLDDTLCEETDWRSFWL